MSNQTHECQECLAAVDKLHDDPRSPPLSTDPCLCGECHDGAIEQMISDAEDDIETLRGNLLGGGS